MSHQCRGGQLSMSDRRREKTDLSQHSVLSLGGKDEVGTCHTRSRDTLPEALCSKCLFIVTRPGKALNQPSSKTQESQARQGWAHGDCPSCCPLSDRCADLGPHFCNLFAHKPLARLRQLLDSFILPLCVYNVGLYFWYEGSMETSQHGELIPIARHEC